MPDVIDKIITTNGVVQGSAVIATVSPVLGNKAQTVEPTINESVGISGVSTRYETRFDDVGYY